MNTKARLHQLAADLNHAVSEAPAESTRRDPNPARGQRGDFHKVTITLPIDMLRELCLLGLERRAEGARSTGVSELVREAVQEFLEKAHGKRPPGAP